MEELMTGRGWGTLAAFAAIALSLPVSLRAQGDGRLVGAVVTENRGIPIPGAMVALDAGQRTTADDEGLFVLDEVRAGPYRIAAVAPGCHVGLGEVYVEAGHDTRIRVSVPLPPDAEELLSAWTLGTRYLGEQVKVFTAEDIRKRHVQTIQDALRIIAPDMVVGETSQVGGRPALRNRGAPTVGADPSPLVIVDGIQISQRSIDALATINPQDIDRIEVMRGGAGGWRYGLMGVNGVVRITTRDASGGYSAQTPPSQCGFVFPR
jgi:hypothetical protein